MWALPNRELKTFPKEGCSLSSVGSNSKEDPLLVKIIECCCFLLLIIIDEGSGDRSDRFVLLKPALSEAVFKLLL